jgi:hypothetical protein
MTGKLILVQQIAPNSPRPFLFLERYDNVEGPRMRVCSGPCKTVDEAVEAMWETIEGSGKKFEWTDSLSEASTLHSEENESPLVSYARKELDIVYAGEAEKVGYNEVLELIRVFSAQDHSGFSASWTTITGEDSEWNEIGEEEGTPHFQNNRCSHVFKDSKDGPAYDAQGRVFTEMGGSSFTGQGSRKWITFPYTPKIEYVVVDAEGEPLSGPSRKALSELKPGETA